LRLPVWARRRAFGPGNTPLGARGLSNQADVSAGQRHHAGHLATRATDQGLS
jgi:hypothetical protein